MKVTESEWEKSYIEAQQIGFLLIEERKAE